MKAFDSTYWDDVFNEALRNEGEDLWRLYMKGVYEKLLSRWMGNRTSDRVLKTDLYDEAVSFYNLFSILEKLGKQVVGIDISPKVTAAAKKRVPPDSKRRYKFVVCDVRKLPFRSSSFDRIVSNSTLDHFSSSEDISIGLKELYRVLKPGGTLVVTLDNPFNPVVFLRNLLPYRFLKSKSIIPYYMGVTLSKKRLASILRSVGFSICDTAFIEHDPRILTVWLGRVVGNACSGGVRKLFLGLLKAFEIQQKSPLSFLSGYFVAFKAVRE